MLKFIIKKGILGIYKKIRTYKLYNIFLKEDLLILYKECIEL